MATWTKNQPSGSATRRKWNLEDRASLNNLKYHIASEGCSEVQYDLAKQLLDQTIEQNEETSNQQAVHWLMCAAQQGHEEAANLLQKCYEEDCGITGENEPEVRSCLSMTPGERAARKAARELFSCLSNGGKHITPRQLERKMREIYNMQKARRQPGDSTSTSEDEDASPRQSLEDGSAQFGNGSINLRHRPADRKRKQRRNLLNVPEPGQGNERITEENLVSAAVNYAAGRMPAVNDSMTLTVPHPSALDHVPCFHRLLFHPIIFFTLLYHRLINMVVEFPKRVPQSVRFAVLLLVYWCASSDDLTTLLPIAFYYICWGTMIWSTCKMLKTKHEFIDFRIWSGLFLSYGDHNIEADISENRFLKNNMQPYLYFFCAFTGNFLVYPLIASDWLPHSELTIVAGIFVFVSMLAFMYSTQRFPDWVYLISFGVNVLAKYPYEMDEVVTTGWRFLDLKVPTFCSFVIGNGIEFCLNCRTALYLLIPMFLIHLAKRSNWHGTYTHLIPHCVTLSWLQLCITSAQSATMFGVVRATLGLAGVLLFLPLFGLVTLLIPVFVAIEWLGFTNPNIRLGSTVVASLLAVLGSCFLAINRTTQKYITVIQVLICITAACVLTFPYMTSSFKDTSRFNSMLPDLKHRQPVITTSLPVEEVHMPPPPSEYLSWQRFYSHCGPQAWWKGNNKIKSQLKCAHLEGLAVAWEGDVTQVQITSVKNKPAWYIDKYLPSWLAHMISCWYGERLDSLNKCATSHDHLCSDFDNILKTAHLDQQCSLHRWNRYEYEIRINMYMGLLDKRQEVVLQAPHKFGNFTKRLIEGDRVHFYGTLTNSRVVSLPSSHIYEEYVLGSSMAHVKLAAIECLQCQDRDNPPVIVDALIKSPVDARMRDLMRGIKYLLNVVLSPLITFK